MRTNPVFTFTDDELNTPFTEAIFFGNEEAARKLALAQAQFTRSFLMVSGLQQPSHCDSEESVRLCQGADERDTRKVEEIARGLMLALGVQAILK